METEQIRKVETSVTVVGLRQSLYEIGGETGGLDQAIAYVESGAVDALEDLALDSSAVVRERQRRLDELGRALAEMSRAKAWLHAKSETASTPYEGSVSYSYNLQGLRGYDFGLKSSSVTRGEVDEVTSRVQHESDIMGNRLNQAVTSLKDYIGRRDKIYTQLEKAMTKIYSGAAKVIREMA